MQIGNRIIYDQDGDIIYQTGEMEGAVLPRKELTKINYIDIPYGLIDRNTEKLIGVDPTATNQRT